MAFKALFLGLGLGGALVAAYPTAPSTLTPNKTLTSSVVTKAVAHVEPLQNSKVKGTVTFQVKDDGVFIIADFEGLSPGKHGFHIHEKGDCSAPDGSSAGAHFNPTNTRHGAPWDKDRHAGDLGNLVADENGRSHFEWHDKQISLKGPDSIIGRAIIVHEKADDLVSQPAGNAGARLACGVIEPAQ